MVDLGITEEDFHTKWYLTGRKNYLLKEMSESLGDAELLNIARELKKVLIELKNVQN